MNAQVVFRSAASRLAAFLKVRGFKRQGQKFVRRPVDGLLSMVEVQWLREPTGEKIWYVIDFGVIVPSLSADDELHEPQYGSCHWGAA